MIEQFYIIYIIYLNFHAFHGDAQIYASNLRGNTGNTACDKILQIPSSTKKLK